MKIPRPEFDHLLASAKKHCEQVAGTTVFFEWWLVNSNGAGFALLREPHHSDEELARAADRIKRDRDVVGKIRVYQPA